jgi:protein ImuB
MPIRIACVRIGRFATGASARPSGRPIIMYTEFRAKLRVVACCAEASKRGITLGMPLTQARALAADLIDMPWDGERIARVALQVTTALLEASPRVAWERGRADGRLGGHNEGAWWVDAAGLGEEKKLAQHLLRIAKRLEFGPVHVGIADSAVAAYAATFRHPSAQPPNRQTAVVPSGRDAAFLARYPIGLLELGEDLAETFAALGLKTVGQIAALDGDEVEARFGPEGLAAHRLARGIDRRGPSLPRDDSLPAAECDLGSPVSSAEPLLFVMKGALASLGSALRARGLAARELTITLALDDGSSRGRAVRPARPTSHEGALFDFCRAALEDWRLEEPVTGITLRATDTVSAAGEQGNLLAARWADPSALDAAFDRIRVREGPDAVARPELRDGHLPTDAGAWKVSETGYRGTEAPRHRKARVHEVLVPPCPGAPVPRSSALRLLEDPLPVRVRLGRSGVEAFRQGETWFDVTAWSGPERIAPRWWRTTDAARDYFGARAADGTLWVLFRARKAWFVEGWWD